MKKFFIYAGFKFTNSKFVKITKDILKEIHYEILDFISNNLRNVSIILRIALPYLMWYMGIHLYQSRGEFTVGGEIFIPLVVFLLTYYIKQYANRLGKGENIPIPDKRFTEEGEEDGEYTIEMNRVEEMIIYMSKLEDYLERKGLLK